MASWQHGTYEKTWHGNYPRKMIHDPYVVSFWQSLCKLLGWLIPCVLNILAKSNARLDFYRKGWRSYKSNMDFSIYSCRTMILIDFHSFCCMAQAPWFWMPMILTGLRFWSKILGWKKKTQHFGLWTLRPKKWDGLTSELTIVDPMWAPI